MGSSDTANSLLSGGARKRPRVRLAWLLVITCIALVLRLNDVEQPFVDKISWRQASTAMMAESLYLGETSLLKPNVRWGGPHPNYQGREFQSVTYLVSRLYHVFGQKEWVGRIVPVAFGCWGVIAVFLLVSKVWGRNHARFAALLLAIMPGPAFIDRSLLPDGPALAMTTTTLWMALCYLDRRRSWLLIATTLLATLAFLTKLSSLTAVPTLLLIAHYAVQTANKPKREIARLGACAALTLATVVAYYAYAIHISRTMPPYHFAGSGSFLWDLGLNRLASEHFFLPKLFRHFTVFLWTFPVLLLAILGVSIPPPKRDEKDCPGIGRMPGLKWAFHLWLAGMGALYVVGAREIAVNFWNLQPANLLAAAFASHGLVFLRSKLNFGQRARIPWLESLILILVGILSHNALVKLKSPWAEPSRDLGLKIRSLAEPGDMAIVACHQIGDPIALYYSGLYGWTFPRSDPDTDWTVLPQTEEEALLQLSELRKEGATWFGVVKGGQDSWGRSLVTHLPKLVIFLRENSIEVIETDDWLLFRIAAADPT